MSDNEDGSPADGAGEPEPGSDEWFDITDDDITLDRAGNPDPTDDLEDPDSADRDLTDMLGAWREDVESEPAPDLVSTDEARDVIADATRRRDDEAAAKRSRENPNTGGTSMSAQEAAARLQQLAGNKFEVGALNEIVSQLEAGRDGALAALGQGHSETTAIVGPFQEALAKAAELRNAILLAYSNCGEVGGRLS